ncbi:MAG: hypothetical protein LJE95_07685 [Acidobacteria bacterium]|jgi:hypothetical protein|nr:hypothetical protein [Acidobacteriota bacterium]
MSERPTVSPDSDGRGARTSERGSALILALMVALILAFLGVGLLLQTSLGLQASGTDRWVVKSLNAADSGLMMAVEMVQLGFVVDPTSGGGPSTLSFVLEDDQSSGGMLKGQYTVTLERMCEVEPPSPIIGYAQKYRQRYLHMEAASSRSVGGLVGTTQATVEADISVWPFDMSNFVPLSFCN